MGETFNDSSAHGIATARHNNRDRRCCVLCCQRPACGAGYNDIDLDFNKLGCEFFEAFNLLSFSKSVLESNVFSFNPPKFTQSLPECLQKWGSSGKRGDIQVPNPVYFGWLRFGLKAKRQEQKAERTRQDIFTHCPRALCLYLISLSALASTVGGIVKPICLAVFRLIANSNLFGCSTGISAGFLPFRILSTIAAICRLISARSSPYDMSPPAST